MQPCSLNFGEPGCCTCTATGCFLQPYGDSHHISRHVKPVKGLLRSSMTNDMGSRKGTQDLKIKAKSNVKIQLSKVWITQSNQILRFSKSIPGSPTPSNIDDGPCSLFLSRKRRHMKMQDDLSQYIHEEASLDRVFKATSAQVMIP